jgi:hypothetical protein
MILIIRRDKTSMRLARISGSCSKPLVDRNVALRQEAGDLINHSHPWANQNEIVRGATLVSLAGRQSLLGILKCCRPLHRFHNHPAVVLVDNYHVCPRRQGEEPGTFHSETLAAVRLCGVKALLATLIEKVPPSAGPKDACLRVRRFNIRENDASLVFCRLIARISIPCCPSPLLPRASRLARQGS